MTYNVHGIDRESGFETDLVVIARDEMEAFSLANAKGVDVTRIVPQTVGTARNIFPADSANRQKPGPVPKATPTNRAIAYGASGFIAVFGVVAVVGGSVISGIWLATLGASTILAFAGRITQRRLIVALVVLNLLEVAWAALVTGMFVNEVFYSRQYFALYAASFGMVLFACGSINVSELRKLDAWRKKANPPLQVAVPTVHPKKNALVRDHHAELDTVQERSCLGGDSTVNAKGLPMFQMTPWRRWTLGVGVVLVGLMLLIPPWEERTKWRGDVISYENRGRAILGSEWPPTGHGYGVRVDTTRLTLQVLFVVTAVATCWILPPPPWRWSNALKREAKELWREMMYREPYVPPPSAPKSYPTGAPASGTSGATTSTFYSIQDAAQKLGIGEDRLKQLAYAGKLPAFRDASNLMFKRDQVDELAAEGAICSQCGTVIPRTHAAFLGRENQVLCEQCTNHLT